MVFKLVLLIFTVAVVNAKNDNLIAVVQIFRHGQRTPVSFYNTDPYSNLDTFWGGLGLGQLTNEGKRQHFALGQFSRRRYWDWLPNTYSNKHIHVETTDVDRTHMSAQANLYGLFSATDTQVWRRGVNWQPIPIHPSDAKVVYSFYPCPLYNSLYANLASEEELVALDTAYVSVYEYLSNKTQSIITDFTQAASLHDSLLIEEQIGYKLPSWTDAVYPEPLTTLETKMYEKFTYNTQMKRLFTGVLLNNILEYFEQMVVDPTSSPKYQMYSAHDTNVFAILNSIDQRPEKPVPFAVSLWFELRTVKFVNVVNLWMKSGDKLTQLSISGCQLDCPLSKVRTLLADILLDVETWKAECAASS